MSARLDLNTALSRHGDHHKMSELLSAVNKLSSKKAVERKNANSNIRRLLSDQNLLTTIDQFSRSKSKSKSVGISWDHLLQLSINHSFEHGKTGTHYKDAISLFKAVIKAGNRRGPEISIKLIVEHCLYLLQERDPDRRVVLVSECSAILLGEVLPWRGYRNVLNQNHGYSDLILSYCRLYESFVDSRTPSAVSVLQQLVLHAGSHGDLPVASLYCFIKDHIVPDIQHEKNYKLVQGLLSLVNTFTLSSLDAGRGRHCKLGGVLIQHLISLWTKCQHSVKKEIITFFRLQISIHFPYERVHGHTSGCVTNNGALTPDRAVFTKGLQALYVVLLTEIRGMSYKLNWKSKTESAASPELVVLTADVIRLVSVLQLCNGSEKNVEEPPPGKRPRQTQGWCIFTEEIPNNVTNPSVLVWLQVLHEVLLKSVRDFPQEEVPVLLVSLHQIQQDVKRVEVVSWTLKCLSALASCQVSNLEQNPGHTELWMQIWSTTVRILSVHNCEEEGFELLSNLLKMNISYPQYDVWKLFTPGFAVCRRWHVDFVRTFLETSTLPEDGFESYCNGRITQFSLRKQIVKFLLQHRSSEELWDPSCSHRDLFSEHLSPHALATVLVSLTQRSSMLTNIVSHQTTTSRTFEGESFSEKLQMIEKLYLSSSFDIPFSCTETDVAMETESKQVHLEKPLSVLEGFLLSQLEEFMREIEKQPDDEVVELFVVKERVQRLHDHLRLLATHCSVSITVLVLLSVCREEGSVPGEHPLLGLSRLLLRNVEKGLKNSLWSLVDAKLRHQLVANVIHDLVPVVISPNLHGNRVEAIIIHSEILQTVFPESLVELIGQVAMGKWCLQSDDSQQDLSSFNRLSNRSGQDKAVDVDLMEDDRREVKSSLSNGAPGLDSGRGRNVEELLFRSAVDVCDVSALSAAELLVGWLEGVVCSRTGGMYSGVAGAVRHMLLSVLSCKKADVNTPCGAQIIMRCSQLLEARELDKEAVEAILKRIQDLLVAHPHDPVVAAHSLQLLQLSCQHFSKPEADNIVELCENFMCAFWKLHGNGRLPPHVRLKFVDCCHSMLLAQSRGTTLSVFTEDNSDQDSLKEVFLSFLTDKSHMVRMRMARLVSVLFLERPDSTRTTQEQVFSAVRQALATSTSRQQEIGNLDDDSHLDESFNLMSSCLATFQTIACVSPVCQLNVILTLFNALGGRMVEEEMVDKMFTAVAAYLGYNTKGTFLASHISSVMSKWLSDKYDITSFPWKLFGEDSLSFFFQKYSQSIVPCLVWASDKESLTKVGEICGTSPTNLIRDCLPRCMLVVMTTYACKKGHQDISDDQLQQASSSHDLLVEYFGENGVSSQLLESMEDFIVNLLSSIHEDPAVESEYSKYFRSCDPPPDLPFFSSREIRLTLAYMSQCYGGTGTLVTNLAKTKDNIQTILQSLTLLIGEAHHPRTKQRLLVGYFLFVRLILEDIATGLNGTSPYIIHSVICTLINLFPEMLTICCDILMEVIKKVYVVSPRELGIHIPYLFSSLLCYTGSNMAEGHAAVQVLSFLVSHCGGEGMLQYWTTVDAVASTGPVKGLIDQLAQIKGNDVKSLKEVIKTFSTKMKSDHRPTSEELRYLRIILKTNRQELSSMIHQGYLSAGHQSCVGVVQQLLSLCRGCHSYGNGCHGDVFTECARCLGELGVFNLNQVSLPRVQGDPTDVLKHLQLKRNEMHTFGVLHLLCQLLGDSNFQMVRVCCTCLKAILCTSLGEGVLAKLKRQSFISDLKWCEYLEPFRGRKLKKDSTSNSNCDDMETGHRQGLSSVCQSGCWYPWEWDQNKKYADWLMDLTVTLLLSGCVQDPVLLELSPLCSIKLEVAELVFPFIFYNILVNCTEEDRSTLSLCVRRFFERAVKFPSDNPQPVVAVLNVIMYLRTIPMNGKSRSQTTAWTSNFWLDVDYLVLSRAAQFVSLPLTSLLCMEIAIGQLDSSSIPLSIMNDDEEDDWGEACGCLETTNPFLTSGTLGADIHAQLVDIYSNIGESDSLYGIFAIFGSSKNSHSNKLQMYEHEGNWLGALGGYVHELGKSPVAHKGVRKAVHNLGWYKLNENISQPMNHQEDKHTLSEYQYEAIWRTTEWGEDCGTPYLGHSREDRCCFSQHICTIIAGLKNRDTHVVKRAIHRGRSAILSDFNTTSESSAAVYPILSKLQCLTELEEVAAVLSGEAPLCDIVLSWQQRLNVMDADYTYIDPVLSLRGVLLHLLLEVARKQENGGKKDLSEILHVTLRSTLLQQADRARKAGQFQISEAAMFSLGQLTPPEGLSEDQKQETEWLHQLGQAQQHWALGETQFAVHALKTLTSCLSKAYHSNSNAAMLYPSTLCLHGNWLAEMRAENPNVIIKKYLLKAVDLIGQLPSNQKLLAGCVLPAEKAYITLARYADVQYQSITRHMLSSNFEAKKSLLRKSKEEAKEVSKLAAQKSEDSRHCQSVLRQLKKHSEEDQAELKSMLEDKSKFLHIAVKNYLLSIKTSDEDNLCVFRLCSLWFDNSQDDLVNEMLKDVIVESRKFLPMLHQLAARMSESAKGTVFQQVLKKIIYSVSKDHPHHSLYILFAMSNATKDEEFPMRGYQCGSRRAKVRKTNSGASGARAVDMDKVSAARSLVSQLSSSHAELVQSVEKLCDAYIDLAYHDTSEGGRSRTGTYPMPSGCSLVKISQLRTVALPTVDIPIDTSCCYDNITYIAGFDSSFRVEGGVNAPKVVSCIGSDGVRKRQLIKGRDDLRQDAVMQQVFGLVNLLLKRDQEASRRTLLVRTYKVVPLSQRSGVVEWCEGTVPYGVYLVHPKEGAHVRYNPHDWPNSTCRKRMEEVTSKSKDQKIKMFKTVTENFKPVMRHFFFEKFSSPVQWFEQRLAYTKSVATSSIVGYILGLGDRHVQNILVDTNSAEVIHIDLGVAFEQGKTLPTPETIPFRLTRDVIDGMGVTGVEGVFRRSCEVTLNTMKASKEEVKTIVEVLLHDPLYMWTIKKLQIQKDADVMGTYTSEDILAELDILSTTQRDGSVSKMAERALLRLQEKLDGYEDGVCLSTSGHINYLIQSATDIRNLSCLFPGWQPWI